MSCRLTIQNRQRSRRLDTRQLRKVVLTLLEESLNLKSVDLGINLVAAPEMTRINETFLQHAGSTDVITFDYCEAGTQNLKLGTGNSELGTSIHGELFICVDEAILQARRFRTTWQSEVVRYIVHGLLHLLGHDDHRPADRRQMKRAENRLLQALARRFALSQLARKPTLRP